MKKGDKVACSKAFLRSTGQMTGAAPFARGVITKVEELSKGGTKLAVIKWKNDYAQELPTKVNVANLVLESKIPFESNPRRNPGNFFKRTVSFAAKRGDPIKTVPAYGYYDGKNTYKVVFKDDGSQYFQTNIEPFTRAPSGEHMKVVDHFNLPEVLVMANPRNKYSKKNPSKSLSEIKKEAKVRHEKARKAAAARGRKDFPLLPYECSWAYEQQYDREHRKNPMYRVRLKHDRGHINLDTFASTEDAAIENVLRAERAPRGAVKSVKELRRKSKKNPRVATKRILGAWMRAKSGKGSLALTRKYVKRMKSKRWFRTGIKRK